VNPAQRCVLSAEQRVFVTKSWGWEDWIWNGKYCGKKLFVKKGKQCSWHYHKVKDEVMYIESGRLTLTYGWDEDESHAAELIMTPGMAFHIPAGMIHRFTGHEDTLITEFSTHHSEKDVVRVTASGGTDAQGDADTDEEDDSDE
jgi:mannose-6-phosphate isomerase-like protein (cupin superfamily)